MLVTVLGHARAAVSGKEQERVAAGGAAQRSFLEGYESVKVYLKSTYVKIEPGSEVTGGISFLSGRKGANYTPLQ